MKKLLALLLAMLVVTVLLAGCVGGDTTEPTNGPGLPSAPSGSDPTDPTYTTDPVTGERVLTRTDLQAAIAELAWSYYTKGTWVQYDSMDLNTSMDGLNNPLNRWMGGHTRLDHFATSTLEHCNEPQYSRFCASTSLASLVSASPKLQALQCRLPSAHYSFGKPLLLRV